MNILTPKERQRRILELQVEIENLKSIVNSSEKAIASSEETFKVSSNNPNTLMKIVKKAKYITLAAFIILFLFSIIALVIGIIWLDNPLIIVEGLGVVAGYLFQYFCVIAAGVAVTGAGRGIAGEIMAMRQPPPIQPEDGLNMPTNNTDNPFADERQVQL